MSSSIDDIENRIIDDDDNDFRKVTLSEIHIPDKNGFKTCGVCGMRLYRGDLATRKKNYRNSFYCGSPKWHIKSEQAYRAFVITWYKKDGFELSNLALNSLVNTWVVKQKRREILAQNHKDWDTIVDKDGKILLDKNDPDYSRIEAKTKRLIANKIQKELETEEAQLLAQLELIRQQKEIAKKGGE